MRCLPGRQVGTTPCPTVADSQILWLSLSGFQPLYGSRRLPVLGRQVGVPADHNPCELYLRDGTAANQTLWF